MFVMLLVVDESILCKHLQVVFKQNMGFPGFPKKSLKQTMRLVILNTGIPPTIYNVWGYRHILSLKQPG